jgi:hypothetical protein
MAGLATMPFNPIEEFRGEYRCIFADLRNALASESSGRLRSTDRGIPTPTRYAIRT